MNDKKFIISIKNFNYITFKTPLPRQASLTDNAGKLQCLRNVQELLINKDPVLLDNMLLEIIQFHRDSSADVRKFVLGL